MSDRSRRRLRNVVLAAVGFCALGATAVVALQVARETPGLQQDGSFLVTTNQAVTPIGIVRRIESARPKDMALSTDGATLAVLCTKYVAFFSIAGDLLQKVMVKPGPLGIAWAPDGLTVYVAGADGKIIRLAKEPGAWKHAGEISVEPPPAPNVRLTGRLRNPQVAGLAVSPDGRMLYAALGIRNAISVIDLATESVAKTMPVGVCPYHVLLSPDGKTLYVSNRGGSKTRKEGPTGQSAGSDLEIDPATDAANSGSLSIIDTVTMSISELAIGRQPGGMALSADGGRLFVASGDDDAVAVVDTRSRQTTGKISITFGKTGFGSLPTSCALSEDGATLYAACGGDQGR